MIVGYDLNSVHMIHLQIRGRKVWEWMCTERIDTWQA
jgi:hypothetical protein